MATTTARLEESLHIQMNELRILGEVRLYDCGRGVSQNHIKFIP
jgi:hypothetical protein